MFYPNLEKESFFLLNVLVDEYESQQIYIRMKLSMYAWSSQKRHKITVICTDKCVTDWSRKCQTATEDKFARKKRQFRQLKYTAKCGLCRDNQEYVVTIITDKKV